MPVRPEHLWYRAEEPLPVAAEIGVELSDGRPPARIDRRQTSGGQLRWEWTGGGINGFAVEAETSGPSFLLTDTNGAPFARIHQRGFVAPRLVAADARDVRFLVEVDGRIVTGPEHRRVLGWIDLPSSRRLHLEVAPFAGLDRDATLRHLLVAVPLCHAVQALLLEV